MMELVHAPIVNPYGEAFGLAWQNDNFVAGLVRFQGWQRLSIRRTGLESDLAMSWEELQSIKSQCGFGHLDAVEVYPADVDVVNTGNMRHLYLFKHPLKFVMRVQPGESLPFEE